MRGLLAVVALAAVGGLSAPVAAQDAAPRSQDGAPDSPPRSSPDASKAASQEAAAESVPARGLTAIPPGADAGFIPLGNLEHQALAAALTSRKLVIDFRPTGKRVRRIHVVNSEPFSKEAGFLQFANIFHIRTREYIMAREVLLRPGEMWDWSVVRDSQRRLRNSLFSSLAVIVPVKSEEAGTVDLLVVTRDIFSLRLNSDFAFVGSTLTSLQLSPSENNFLGLRKQASLNFNLGLGRYSLGPSYRDPNIAGTRMTLVTAFALLFSRDTNQVEGSTGSLSLNYPLYDLRSLWAAGIGLSFFEGVARQFDEQDVGVFVLRQTINPATGTALPHIWDQTNISVGPSVTRSFPTPSVIQRLTMSYQLRTVRPRVRDDFFGFASDPSKFCARDCRVTPTDDDAQFFRDEIMPRSERASIVRLSYNMFQPTFVVYRNVDTYDLPEEARVGPSASASAGFSVQALGSETDFVELGASAGWVHDLGGDSFVSWSIDAGARFQIDNLEVDGNSRKGFIDSDYGLGIRFVTPTLFDVGRVVTRAGISVRVNETQNRRFALGGDSLRGFPLNVIQALPPADSRGVGPFQYSGNAEFRTRATKVWFSRVGGVAFLDVGDNAEDFADLRLRSDIGVGMRMLFPELQPSVFRIDLAFPLTCGAAQIGTDPPYDPCPASSIGIPFRLTGGFAQAF